VSPDGLQRSLGSTQLLLEEVARQLLPRAYVGVAQGVLALGHQREQQNRHRHHRHDHDEDEEQP